MNQNKRFTRSTVDNSGNQVGSGNLNSYQLQLKAKITQLFQQKRLKQAIKLIKSMANLDHQLTCMKAQIFYQLRFYSNSLNTVRSALRLDYNDCDQCLKLLLNLIQKYRPKIQMFKKDIKFCLSIQDLKPQIKRKFEQACSQLQNHQQSHIQTTKNFTNLTKYYQEKGLKFKKIQIVQVSPEYRVARAKTDIKPNQTIIFVPEKEMITLQLAKTLPQVHKLSCQQGRLRSPKHCLLSIFLLIHLNRGENSPYYNYIRCLPKNLTNFPVYYGDQQYKFLSGSYFLSLLKRKKIDIKDDYDQILQILPSLKSSVTYDKFLWARMIISSRIFGVLINGKKTDTLVPIADMLNHKTPKTTSWYFCDVLKGFIIQNAGQQIEKGSQIFDSYGTKCNSRFLLNYGFTIPNNQNNQVMICLKKYKKRKKLLPNIRLNTSIDSDQFRNLISYYRQATGEDQKVEQFEQDQSKVQMVEFISRTHQSQVWRAILQTMTEQISQYPTTIKIDEKILRYQQQMPINLRNCVQIRLGEKKVLQFYIKMAKKMIKYFTSDRVIDLPEYEPYIRQIKLRNQHNNE